MRFFTSSKSVGGSGNVATNSYEKQRENTADQTNSISYSVLYFRNKLHLNQNENVSCLRLHIFLLWDGYSGMIDSHFTVTENSKSNIILLL